jgi:hypothetical protein
MLTFGWNLSCSANKRFSQYSVCNPRNCKAYHPNAYLSSVSQELCASVALHTSNEEDILLRALSVINEKKRRLRLVKDQLADVQSDFKLFKERTAAAAAAAAAAAQASSPLKKRPKVAGCVDGGTQSETSKQTVGGERKSLSSIPPQNRSIATNAGAFPGAIVGRDAQICAEQHAPAAVTAGAPAPALAFSQLSQSSVSTQELTKNFPWANLGL